MDRARMVERRTEKRLGKRDGEETVNGGKRGKKIG